MANQRFRTLTIVLVVFAFGSILLSACARPGATTGTASGTTTSNSSSPSPSAPSCPTGKVVKTGTTTFEQPCIALSKGGTLQITPDQPSVHILDYGTWNGNTQQKETPRGVPALSDVHVGSSAVNIGPFTTAGTFHIYCTIHPGMTLTV